ncbi:unnamed protein product [Bemisia tabaci]|uniref:AAA-ATPase-like domain-containing protein n=2 Tax=Bemisia tabaci TaxID=7038 RepID=A0A9N9ZX70_BEMTA|nr:unnamed protein product [Bemisia tabaci]
MKLSIEIEFLISVVSAIKVTGHAESKNKKEQAVESEKSANTVVKTSEFTEILGSRQFVDKSLFLRWFISEGKDLYITGPSGLGKSTLLSMMRTFFTAQFHNDGTYTDPKTTKTRDFFKAPSRFDGTQTALKIYQHEDFFEKHFQRYCVIFVNLHPLKFIHDISSFEARLLEIVGTVFKSFKIPDRPNCREIKSLVDVYENMGLSLSEFDMRRVEHVSQFLNGLWSCFNKKCIVLIDEYDAILHALMSSNVTKTDSGLVFWEVHKVVEALTKHQAVLRALCVGVLNLGGAVASLADHIPHVHFFADERIPRYFGFSDSEVGTLLGSYGMASDRDSIVEFYSGYRVMSPRIGRVLNAASILSCIENKGVSDGYFKVSGRDSTFDVLFSEPVFGEKILLSVMENAEIDIALERTGVGVNRILDLSRQIRENAEFAASFRLTDSGMDYVFQYLLESGYFTIARGLELLNTTRATPRSVRIKIMPANLETKHILYRTLFASQFPLYSYRITPENIDVLGAALNNLSEASLREVMKSVREFSQGKSAEGTHLRFPVHCVNRLMSSGKVKIVEYENAIEENGKVVALALVNLKNEGVVIQLERNETSIDTLSRMVREKYGSVFHIGKFAKVSIERRVLVALRCTCVDQCDMCFTLDSRSISNATCATYPENESLEKNLYLRKTEIL